MVRLTSDIRDDFQICFSARRYGWSDLFIILDSDILRMRVSEVFTDVAEELINVARAIIANCSIRVALSDEPGGYILELRADPKLQHTMIFAAYEVQSGCPVDINTKGKKTLEFRVKRRQLLAVIMTELWKVQEFMKEPSYQKARSSVPSHELHALNAAWHEDQELGPSFLK